MVFDHNSVVKNINYTVTIQSAQSKYLYTYFNEVQMNYYINNTIEKIKKKTIFIKNLDIVMFNFLLHYYLFITLWLES